GRVHRLLGGPSSAQEDAEGRSRALARTRSWDVLVPRARGWFRRVPAGSQGQTRGQGDPLMPVTLGDKSDTSQFVFRKGESFTAVVYSNTAGTIRGNVRVVYDDGTEDDFKFNETSSGSARAGVILTCAPHVTARPGIVVSMFLGVSGAINQRGMCFAQVWMTNDPQSSGAISLLAQGYIYIGSPLMLGVYVEPGPAGGHGAITRVNANTTGNGAAGRVLGVVPTGALWYWIIGTVVWTDTATVGTRNVLG